MLFREKREILVMRVEVGFAMSRKIWSELFERSMEFVTYVVSEYGGIGSFIFVI